MGTFQRVGRIASLVFFLMQRRSYGLLTRAVGCDTKWPSKPPHGAPTSTQKTSQPWFAVIESRRRMPVLSPSAMPSRTRFMQKERNLKRRFIYLCRPKATHGFFRRQAELFGSKHQIRCQGPFGYG